MKIKEKPHILGSATLTHAFTLATLPTSKDSYTSPTHFSSEWSRGESNPRPK